MWAIKCCREFPANSSGRNAVRQHKEQVEAIVAEHLNRLLKDSQRVSYIASQLFIRRVDGKSWFRG